MSDYSSINYEAALKQAIIRVKPDYYSWPTEERERYGVNIPDEEEFQIKKLLLKSLFQIKVNNENELKEVLDDFSEDQYLLLNCSLLPLTGIGENNFFLNEFLGEKTLLDFPTLYDYDYDEHQFQQETLKETNPGYIEKAYRGSLFLTWARLTIDGKFYYATLSCLAGYLYNQIDEIGFNKILELIPFEYVDGKDHGKEDEKGVLYDKRVDAGGMEGQLDDLESRYYEYIEERLEILLDEFDKRSQKQVYLVERRENNEPHMVFIFSEKTALKAVRFRNFMDDCQDIIGSNSELNGLIERERKLICKFLEDAYQDIMTNFDSKVKKFRKKRKVVLEDKILKDLL
jgi:hypothetical protein